MPAQQSARRTTGSSTTTRSTVPIATAAPDPAATDTAADARDGTRPVRTTGPRVTRLLGRLAADDGEQRAALSAEFWRDVERLGTPLIEEIEDEPDHRAVTFLWRGHRATRQVLLLANRLTDRRFLAGSLLEQVPGTDVWHLGLKLRADHRGTYRLAADISVNEPPADPEGLQHRLRGLSAHAAADPLNPRTVATRWDAAESSVFALPHAPAQPWAQRVGTVPAGRVERHRVGSAVLGEDRDVRLYLPTGVAHGRPLVQQPLPVVVLCDGDMWFGRMGLEHTLDVLIADGTLPPLAVVAPEAVDRHTRWRDLGGRDPFVAFLADELLPWAATRAPLTNEPGRTVVAGQSLGGTTALYAALTRPERFGAVLAQSPSLWWRPGVAQAEPKPPVDGLPWLVERHTAARLAPTTFHVDVGLHEGAMVDHARTLTGALRAGGHRVTHGEFNGGHDHACWHGALADGLVGLLGTARP
ncbi:enterochelin esterase [Streptomyces sp. NPDC090306]|uniref:enterochelin esterase n=1 Tax=Streptomyces sp. NPDC090306 TaxID=3365961 RepID=UPI003816C394